MLSKNYSFRCALCASVLAAWLTGPAAAQDAPARADVTQAIRDVQSDNWIVQLRAMNQLASAPAAQAAPVLKTILNDPKASEWSRRQALVTLAQLLKGDVLADALAGAKHASPLVRSGAVEALGIIGNKQAAQAVADAMKDASPLVRNQALVATARLGKEAAWPTIKQNLASQDVEAVCHAVKALGFIGNEESRKALIDMLAHKQPAVRIQAARTAGQLQLASAIGAILARGAGDGDAEVQSVCTTVLGSFPAGTLAPQLMAALRSDQKAQYPLAVKLLGKVADRQACDDLARLLRSPSKDIESMVVPAMDVLAGCDADAYQYIFVSFLDHKEPAIRQRSVVSLARCSKADLFSLLRNAVSDDNSSVAAAAVSIIAKSTAGSPKEGILNYLSKALTRTSYGVNYPSLLLVRDRMTQAELEDAWKKLAPFFGSSGEEYRNAAAAALDRFCDDDGRRRIALMQGYVNDWMIAGMFQPIPGIQDGKSYAPEKSVDFNAVFDALGGGAAVDASTGKAVELRTPAGGGRTILSVALDVPFGEKARLSGKLSARDAGVSFELLMNGKSIVQKKLDKAGSDTIDADITDFNGTKVALELVVLTDAKTSGAVSLEAPLIEAGGRKVAVAASLAGAAVKAVLADGSTTQLSWKPYRPAAIKPVVLLDDIFPNHPMSRGAAYAVADVQVNADVKASMEFFTFNPATVWVNGKNLGEFARGLAKIPCDLKQGANRIMVKSLDDYPLWQFHVRLVNDKGNRIEFTQPKLAK